MYNNDKDGTEDKEEVYEKYRGKGERMKKSKSKRDARPTKDQNNRTKNKKNDETQ